MVIYLEDAIIDNMVINTLLLFFVFMTMKQRAPRWRIFAAAVVGTAFAIVLPMTFYDGALALLVRLFVGAFMVFIVQSKGLRRYLLTYILFLTYTFALGGMVYAVLIAFFPDGAPVPMGLLLGVVAVFALIMRLLIKYLNVRHSISNHLRDVVIYHRGEKFKIAAYLDTGNQLSDPESGHPVVVISLSLFQRMFPEVTPDRIVLEKLDRENIVDGRYIALETISGKSKMFTFQPTQFEIESKQHDNVRLGVSMRGLGKTIKYDALLNAQLA